MSIEEFRRVAAQIIVPGEAIDSDFHDAQVRHCSGELRIHHRAQMP